MPFKKGKSGNPGGRPKAEEHVRDLARARGKEAFARILKLSESDDERIALAACQEILNRAYGRPTQAIAGDADADPVRVITRIENVIVYPDGTEESRYRDREA